jgi:RHS repeat-associated protein
MGSWRVGDHAAAPGYPRRRRSSLQPGTIAGLALLIAALVVGTALAAPGGISTVAGTGVAGYSGDGAAATAAKVNLPRGVGANGASGYYVADSANNRIRKVDGSGTITTVAGNGTACATTTAACGDGAAATAAQLRTPWGVSALSGGGFLIADTSDNRIRKVNTSGTISTVAGTGTAGFSGDAAAATAAKLNAPGGVTALSDGSYLIADSANFRIRKVTTTGTISTVAGNGTKCATTTAVCGDGGAATSANLGASIADVAPLSGGGFLIADSGDNRIRKVSAAGTITTVAGTGTAGFTGDGGAATSATLSAPSAVQPTADGGYLIADTANNRIRKVSASGTISTVAGTGTAGFSGDGGPASAAALKAPFHLALLSDASLLIADRDNSRIRRIEAAAAPTLSATQPASPSSSLNPSILGSAASGTSIALFTSSTCSGTTAASGTAAALASPGLSVTVPPNSTTTFYGTASISGLPSPCSNGRQYVSDNTAPSAQIDSGPTGSTRNRRPTFGFSSNDPNATFTCSIDTGTANFAACSGPGNSHKPAADLALNSYTFRVKAIDAAGNSSTATRAFTVTDANGAPTNLALSPSSVPENQPAGTTVGTLSSTDPDPEETFSYSLVAGAGDADNTSFQINGSALKSAASFDYETKASYSIRVRTTDSFNATFEKQLTPTVTNANDAPTHLTLSSGNVDEGQPAGTTVGNLSSTDQDPGDTFTYSLAAGTGDVDNAAFQVVGSTLKTAATFDYETDSSYSVRVRTDDGHGGTYEDQFGVTINPPPLPPITPPVIDDSVPTNTYDATQFIYSDSNPVQVDIDPQTIDPERVAVLRGRVTSEAGDPLSAVVVSAPDHPEFGETLTRDDGRFYFAVNGGVEILLQYEREGYATAQRIDSVPVQDYDFFDDVVLVALDSAHEEVDLDGAASGAQVVQGSPVSDGEGTRQQTLIFPPGTEADMKLGPGQTEPVDAGTVRTTEYTVGGDGLESMPGELPPTSDYTYAAEFSLDEAVDSDAQSVVFSKPVVGYLDNFIDIPVGADVPVGSYNRARGVWVPEPDGRVVKVLSESGGSAVLDVDGSGQPATQTQLNDLGVSASELAKVAALYEPGDELWRTTHDHFTPMDFNYPDAGPSDARRPEGDLSPEDPDAECQDPGSIIYCESQSLGEELPLTGTGMSLHYRSDRSRGRKPILDVPLIDSDIPQSLLRVEVTVYVAGRRFEHVVQKADLAANDIWRFRWDGDDAFGRPIYGPQRATVSVTYVFISAGYDGAAAGASQSFGQLGTGPPMTSQTRRGEYEIANEYQKRIGTWDARSEGLGGWTITPHHVYDPTTGVLFMGDGRQRRVLRKSVTTMAGGGENTGNPGQGDGGPASQAHLYGPNGMDFGPDGSLYVADFYHDRVRKIAPGGTVSTVAGSDASWGQPGTHFSGDGGPAIDAQLDAPRDVAVAPDGTLYICDEANSRIRKVTPDGTISTVVGDGNLAVDDGPGTQAGLDNPVDLGLGPDGTLYIADSGHFLIRALSPDGRVSTFAGQNGGTFPTGDNTIPAADLLLWGETGLAVDGQGNVYVTTNFYTWSQGVYKITPQGRTSVVAGGNGRGYDGDGGPANQAQLHTPGGVDVDSDGNIVFSDDYRIRQVTPDGLIETVAGGTNNQGGDWADEDRPPNKSYLGIPQNVLATPDGGLLISSWLYGRVFRVGTSRPRFTGQPLSIPSEDGSELYEFSAQGRHLRTVDGLTGETLYDFNYEPDGDLVGVTDRAGNVTEIERTPGGKANAIVSPYGQTTDLTVNANDELTAVANPEAETYDMSYSPAGQLSQLTDPRNHVALFDYDQDGFLIKDDDAGPGYTTLTRNIGRDGYDVTLESKLGHTHNVHIKRLDDGSTRRRSIDSAGLATTQITSEDRLSSTMSSPDGMSVAQKMDSDPRFGGDVYYPSKTTVSTPAGKQLVIDRNRQATLSDRSDPFSFETATENVSVNGRTSTTVFNAAAHTFSTTTAGGRSMQLTINGDSQPTLLSLPGLTSASYDYDTRGRLSAVTQGARSWGLTYDVHGNVATATNPVNETQSFAYDDAGRLITQTLPDNRVLSYGYDADGNLTSVTPPGRTAHTSGHNARNNQTDYTPPSLGDGALPTTYSYNDDGDMTAIHRPDGSDLGLGYDSAGRLDTVTEPGGALTRLDYDPSAGTLTSIDGPNAVDLDLTYDGSLPTAEQVSGPVAGTVSHSYDNDLRVSETKVNGADPVAYSYDDDSLLTGAGDLALGRSATTGQLTSTSLDTVQSSLSYNAFGELESDAYDASGTGVYSSGYVRDDAGRVTQKTETTSAVTTVWEYGYDTAGRLEDVNRNGADYSHYTYDSNGNRTILDQGGSTTSSTYDAQDRLETRGSWTYDYTLNGDLETKTNTSSGATTGYEYDALGNLDHVDLPSGTDIDYLTDGLGRRVAKKINGTVDQGFLYGADAIGPAAELDAAGAVRSRFVYGTSPVAPDYMVRGGTTYRIVTDQLGSPRMVVNAATGAVQQQIEYGPFGEIVSDSNPGFQPFGFAGGLYDKDTGLVRFGARDYDPETGRWTAKDPIGFAGGDPNLYGYVLGDPVNLVDPSGLLFGFVGDAIDGVTDAVGGFVEDNWQSLLVGGACVLAPGLGCGAALGITTAITAGNVYADPCLGFGDFATQVGLNAVGALPAARFAAFATMPRIAPLLPQGNGIYALRAAVQTPGTALGVAYTEGQEP